MPQAHPLDTSLPVRFIPGDENRAPEEGIALCLSGGGYRAMLFHLGSLWRLNQLGLLPKLKRVSSVSGGSLMAGLLGMKWKALAFDAQGVATNFETEVVAPIRAMARRTVDLPSIAKGLLLPGSVADYIISAYRDGLFGDATLQDLPSDEEGPRFVINATNVQSGALWRFSRPYMADYLVGRIERPMLPLAVAVAASAAFPPLLSPVTLPFPPRAFVPNSGLELQRAPYTRKAVLTDGGVYDNLGLETCWKLYKTILVSDACEPTAPDPQPKHDWPRHAFRTIIMINNEVQALRKQQLIDSYTSGLRTGAYWGISSDIAHYDLPDALPAPHTWHTTLPTTPTRLSTFDEGLQERLINWGFALTDAGIRKHLLPNAPRPSGFPYSI